MALEQAGASGLAWDWLVDVLARHFFRTALTSIKTLHTKQSDNKIRGPCGTRAGLGTLLRNSAQRPLMRQRPCGAILRCGRRSFRIDRSRRRKRGLN